MTTTSVSFEGKELTSQLQGGIHWVSAHELCRQFGISNPSLAISQFVGSDHRRKLVHHGIRQWFVSIPGAYLILLGSKSPKAIAFRSHLALNVLPQLHANRFVIIPPLTNSQQFSLRNVAHKLC